MIIIINNDNLKKNVNVNVIDFNKNVLNSVIFFEKNNVLSRDLKKESIKNDSKIIKSIQLKSKILK